MVPTSVLSYATISETFENIDQLQEKYDKTQQKVTDFSNTYRTIDANNKAIEKKTNQINNHPINNIEKSELKENEKFNQMVTDSQSMILQNKFTIALGGIAIASMIILHSQL
jgi:hypothetical protein